MTSIFSLRNRAVHFFYKTAILLITCALTACGVNETDGNIESLAPISTDTGLDISPINLSTIKSDEDFYANFKPQEIMPIVFSLDYTLYSDFPGFTESITEIRALEIKLAGTIAQKKYRALLGNLERHYGLDDIRVIHVRMLALSLDCSLGDYKLAQKMLNLIKTSNTKTSVSEHAKNEIRSLETSIALGIGEVDRGESLIEANLKSLSGQTDSQSLAMLGDVYYSKGIMLHLRGKYAESAKQFQTSLKYRLKVVGPDNYIIPQNKLAIAGVLSQARDPRAMELARDALETAERILPQTSPELAKAMEVMGLELQRSGYISEAVELFPKAIEIKAKALGEDNLMVAFAINNLASLQSSLGRHELSVELYLQARDGFIKNQGEKSFMAANAARSAASGMLRLGRAVEALDYRERALAVIDEKLPLSHRDNYRTRIGLTDNYITLGRYDEAVEQGKSVVSGARETLPEEHEDYIIADIYLASAQFQKVALSTSGTDLRIDAANTLHTAIDRLVAHSKDRYDMEAGQTYSSLSRVAISQGLRAAVIQDDPERTLKYLQIRSQSTLGGTIGDILDREKASDPVLAALLRKKQNAFEVLRDKERAYYKAFTDKDKKAGIDIAKAAYTTAKLDLNRIAETLADDYPKFVTTGRNPIYTFKDIQAAIGTDEAVLMVDNSNADTFIMAISGQDYAIVHLPLGTHTIETYVQAIGRSVAPDTSFNSQAAGELYTTLFNDAVLPVTSQAQTLKIISNGALSNIPFSYLVTDLAAPRYLIDEQAISILPSLNGLFIGTQTSTVKGKAFLGIGDPTYKRTSKPLAKVQSGGQAQLDTSFGAPESVLYRGGQPDPLSLSQFSKLPRTKSELKKIARYFDKSTILLGKNATETRLKSMDFSEYGVIAFATHGVVANEILGQGEPGLVLSQRYQNDQDNGFLTSGEILQLELNADWVVLSACNTAAGQSLSASAYSGLTRSFLHAGADSLLVSHWPVRDDAAAFLTVETVKNTRAGLSKAEALRKAMRDLRDKSKIKDSENPFIWAPFVLVEG